MLCWEYSGENQVDLLCKDVRPLVALVRSSTSVIDNTASKGRLERIICTIQLGETSLPFSCIRVSCQAISRSVEPCAGSKIAFFRHEFLVSFLITCVVMARYLNSGGNVSSVLLPKQNVGALASAPDRFF